MKIEDKISYILDSLGNWKKEPKASYILKLLQVLTRIPNDIKEPDIFIADGSCFLKWAEDSGDASVLVSFCKEIKYQKKWGIFKIEVEGKDIVEVTAHGRYGEFCERVTTLDEILNLVVPILDNKGFTR